MTYSGVGVDYEAMDPFKRMAQEKARETSLNLERFGFSEVSKSRGESAYLIKTPFGYVAHVEEGLGTKNLVADEIRTFMGRTYYDALAQDTVAMIVNDMITLGALPVSLAMHLAVGSSEWFSDERRARDLIDGWKKACILSGAVWGGGETPTLKGIIGPEASVLAGSSWGIIQKKKNLIRGNIRHGDAIILIEGSGIHANGLTLARKIAEKVTDGYEAILPDRRTYGESLLDPTPIYVPIVHACQLSGIHLHYAVNITGHGWRKLMRLQKNFAYVIEKVPYPQHVFRFMQKHGNIDDSEAYGNFNMGAGFALYVPKEEVETVLVLARSFGFSAFEAGHIEKSKEKKVVILPKNLVYLGDTLAVR